jgi:hypothetical protein
LYLTNVVLPMKLTLNILQEIHWMPVMQWRIYVNDTQSVVFDNPLVLCSLINFQTAGEVIPF